MASPFVPDGFQAPASFSGPGFRLEPLGPEHNERDHAAWMASIDHIHSTPGWERSKWPRPMTLEENLEDLVGHADDFTARRGFTYSILDGDDVIGCLYIYPGDDGVNSVLSWVTASRHEMDRVVWEAISEWISVAWPFDRVAYASRD
jgi:hypothetical protein